MVMSSTCLCQCFHSNSRLRRRRNQNSLKTSSRVYRSIIIIYHSMGNFVASSNFHSKFRFHPRILRYRRFPKFTWADSKNFHCTQRKIWFQIEWYAYFVFPMFSLVKISNFQKMINTLLLMTGSEFLRKQSSASRI